MSVVTTTGPPSTTTEPPVMIRISPVVMERVLGYEVVPLVVGDEHFVVHAADDNGGGYRCVQRSRSRLGGETSETSITHGIQSPDGGLPHTLTSSSPFSDGCTSIQLR